MKTVVNNKPDQKTMDEGVAHLEDRGNGVQVLHLGARSEPVVTLTERRLDSLREVLLRLESDSSLRGLIVTGPGPGMFAAGADIKLIQAIEDPKDGALAAAKGQEIFGLLQKLEAPVVAAIEGPCLGGGYEFALCCDVRVASNARGTLVGLPEVKLGIVPGFGGTQRLARLVGLPKSLDLILQGKTLKPEKALRQGLVDRVVPSERLMQAAEQELQKLMSKGRKSPRRKLRGMDSWLSKLPFMRAFIANKVRKKLSSGQARFYPAPLKALQLCVDAFSTSLKEGLAREARALGELIASPTCKALVRLYFLTERAKRLGKAKGAVSVRNGLVVGGGVMGAGIAGLMASRGVKTRLCDLEVAPLAKAKARLQKTLDKLVRRRSLKKHEAVAAQDRLAVSANWGHLDRTNIFLEAVVERLDVKRTLFGQAVELGLPDEAVIATNTSSLPVDEMAEGLPAPERVVGMHFFNPPEKMPLVEVIRGPRTSDATVATVCKLAVKLGKFPVVVKDSPGFLVNRCLAPYLNEAARLMVEGNDPEFIDRVMLDFGLPMGPARLMDEVGFDVACKVSEVMANAFGDRMQPCPLFDAMVAAECFGTKVDKGLYTDGGKKPDSGRAVLDKLRQDHGAPRQASRSEVLERLIYPMVDEAYRCLDEGLIESEEDLDLGLVMGMGFPPFTGGISAYAKQEGLKQILTVLEGLATKLDPKFEPGNGLRNAAAQNDAVE